MRIHEKRRVVVTGMGMITPSGKTVDSFWQSLLDCKSAIGKLSLIDTSEQVCKIAGEIPDFNPEDYMDKKEARRMDRFTQFAMAAAKEAYEDAKLNPDSVAPERFGVVVGSAAGGITTIEWQLREVLDKGFRRTSPFLIPMMICDMGAGRIAIQYNAKGPNMAVVTACATGAHSTGDGFRIIENDEADVVFVGGAEAPLTPISVSGFAAARALSLRNDSPEEASRPFDVDRDGFVMSEGASLLILEELNHALQRGAKIYGEVIGYGRSADANDIVSPSPDGNGAALAMKAALRDAGIQPEEVDYINAHGTSTPLGDIAETKAVKHIFGDHALSGKLLVSSTKSMTGHLLGAAGSAEAAISLLALRDQIIPPTINLENPDPECDLDYVANTPRKVEGFKVAMSNSFGFGGHNASLIFRAWEQN
jgi:3-oxoacyl-[acyl-carrier-protein] synthase II